MSKLLGIPLRVCLLSDVANWGRYVYVSHLLFVRFYADSLFVGAYLVCYFFIPFVIGFHAILSIAPSSTLALRYDYIIL